MDTPEAGTAKAETVKAETVKAETAKAETADGAGVSGRPSPGRRTDFVQSLDRGLAVIRCFSSERPSLTLS